jgi:hypothetical protein
MRNLEKISSREIEEALIADADNVDSWDEPIKVAASKSPRPDWYRQQQIPVGLTLVNCGDEVDAQEVYRFIAAHVEGASAYRSRPSGVAAAALDFYLVLDASASVASIANVLWMAYDRFILPKKRRMHDSAGIYVAARGPDGKVIDLWLGKNVSTKESFTEQLEVAVAEGDRQGLRTAHQETIRELEQSDLWVRLDGED